jgi:hypothetical protein
MGTAWAQQERMTLERKMEYRHKVVLEAPERSSVCSARVEIEYRQKNTIAETEGTIHTEDCEAASGVYTVAARYRDEDGQVHNIESENTWSRMDDQPVHFSAELIIGENVDLIRVSARKIRCECAATDAAQTDTQGENE